MEDDEMKVLGISFGRRNQRCDVMVKEALFAAKAAGAEVRFINTRFRHFENLKTPIILINTGIAGVFFGKKCCM